MMRATGLVVAACLMAGGIAEAQPERVERGTLVMEGIPDIPQALTERLRQYQNTRSARLADWRPDGGMLVSTRFGQVSQLHTVAGPGAARRQVTFFDEPIGGGRYATSDRHRGFVFSKDVGGNEWYQLHFFDEATGQTRLLTDGGSRNGAYVLSNGGDLVAHYSTRRDGKSWDIWTVSLDGADTARMVFKARGQGVWTPLDFSPDDTRLLLRNYISVTNSRLAVLDLATGALTRVDDGGAPAAWSTARFTGDGTGLYAVTDKGSEFRTLRHWDIASGRLTELTGDLPWDVGGIELSPDGAILAYRVNEGGLSRLHLRRTADFSALPTPDLPVGVVSDLRFDADGRRLGFSLNRATGPRDVYSWDVDARTLTRWTESEVGGLDTAGFVEPELVGFPTFDSADGGPDAIPAFVFKPADEGPHPVIVVIHGGPESQYRPGYSSAVQFWVAELGFAVVAPNVRGSTGYGRTYVGLDNGFKREDSVRDIGALLDWIATRPDLDADRVVVYGGSYGGYMVLASMTHYSDRLLGGVNIVGISNFVTFLTNTKDYRRDLRRVEYGDERDPDMYAFLQRISPLNNAERITKPLFIIQGLNDPRVPVTESEQMLNIVRNNGGDVWYLMARDEGHGFRKKANRDVQAAATALFLDKLLGRPIN